MDDEIDGLLIEVRAGTEGFARDVARMRSSVDGELVGGFTKAGDVLERGLTSAIRKGSLGFDDLKRVALDAMDTIAAQSLRGLLGGAASSGAGFDLSGLAGALLGLPGRATGGNVAPGRGYLVGERGPEVFVPTSAGRVEPSAHAAPRDVRVSINLAGQAGASAPRSLQRSSRQVASAVRRALTGN